jgi:hypothetical protein
MRFSVTYKRQPAAAYGAADITFLVETEDASAAEEAAAELYAAIYGQSPEDDLAEIISVRLSP